MKKGTGQIGKKLMAVLSAAAILMTTSALATTALADEATYTAYSAYQGSAQRVQADYTMVKGGTSVISYCLNNRRNNPDPKGTGGYKRVETTSANIASLVGTGSPRISGDQLKNKLFALLLNGYGNNASGLQQKYGVRDKLFRDATQNAIWYYTDNISYGDVQHYLGSLDIDVSVEPGTTMLALAASDASVDEAALNDTEKQIVREVREVVKLYQELLNVSVSDEYTRHHQLNIYVTGQRGGDAGKPGDYQNMVDVSAITENPKKEVVFSKTAVNGTSELPGATLKVWEGSTLIEEWVSTTETHLIKLFAGDYTMEEITAPEGYLKAESIRFRVTDDMKVQVFENGAYVDRADAKVHMQDAEQPKKEVVFSKTAVNGTGELPGATLKVTRNSDNKVIEEWVSSNATHVIRLLPGEYTMTEITAPEGYEVAENIVFRVTEGLIVEVKEGDNFVARENATVHMQDKAKPVEVPVTPTVNEAPAAPATPTATNDPGNQNTPNTTSNNNTPAATTPVNNTPATPSVETTTTVTTPEQAAEAASANAQKVLGQSRSPRTEDEAPIALLLALFGIALVGIGVTTHVWKKS